MGDSRKPAAPRDGIPGSSRFLHGTVAEWLRLRLSEGSLAAGDKLPPLREIADRFAVSTATVRRAIRTLEREGYVNRIPDVGVFVRHGDSASSPRQAIVTFVANDLISPFEAALARALKQACRGYGWDLQIFEGHDDRRREQAGLLRLRTSGSQGAIVLPSCTPESVQGLHGLRRAGFPLVLVDRGVPGLNADLVESDHEGAARKATDHLIRNGHSCVIMVTPPPGVLPEQARILGYEQSLRESGIEPQADWRVLIDLEVEASGDRLNQRWMGAYEAVKPVLGQFKPPFAVFAHNDNSGWGVYKACESLGLRIPEDVSIICVDDSDIARAMTPPMTTVAQRTDEIGRQAVEMLRHRIEGAEAGPGQPASFRHAVIDVDLVERRSVARVK